MLHKKNLLTIFFLGAFIFSHAQQNQTGKVKVLTPYTYNKAVASDNVVLTINKTGDEITVTANTSARVGFAWSPKGVQKLSGKLIFTNGAETKFELPRGSFGGAILKLNDNQSGTTIKSTTLSADGSFGFTGVPNGTYQLVLKDIVVAKGWKVGGE